MKREVKIHMNMPQLMVRLVWTRIMYIIWGRGTGKSEGPNAQFTFHNIHALPRSNGFLLGTTYDQLLTRTIPPLIASWEKMGFKENKHFWMRKFAPEKLRIPKAFRVPTDPVHYIHTYTGTGIYLVSQDRSGTSNGIRTYWGSVDEAKFINKKKFDKELKPTMIVTPPREWQFKSEFGSIMFLSDMPDRSSGRWLIDAKKLVNQEIIDSIIHTQIEVIKLEEKFENAAESTKKKMRLRLQKLYDDLNWLRVGSVYYSTASTFDNIHALGWDAIAQMQRDVSRMDFLLSVCNQEMLKLETGFYSPLDDEIHGYNMTNYSYVDSLDFDFRSEKKRDCRWDADIDKTKALNVACDYNNKINSIVTGQRSRDDNEYRFLSSIYVLSPDLIKECVRKWHEYYKYHPKKLVYYYYDHTAKGGKSAGSNFSFKEQWIKELRDLKWIVVERYIGHTPDPADRKAFWDVLLQGEDPRLPKFKYNKTNCKSWEVSAMQAGVRYVGENKELKKDKRPEEDDNVPPQEATHLSDAGDTLIWGELKAKINRQSEYVSDEY